MSFNEDEINALKELVKPKERSTRLDILKKLIRVNPVYIIRTLIISQTGMLLYYIDKVEDPNFTKTIQDKTYTISKEGLYKKRNWLYKELWFKICRIHEYWILFMEGNEDPVLPSNPKVSPYELYLINNSTATKGSTDEYTQPDRSVDTRRLFIIILIALVLGYLFIKYGGVNISI